MDSASPVLLIPDISAEIVSDLNLPPLHSNVFHRLIRNPRPNTDNPRERECTEMLAAVLLNAPELRTALLSWMGTLVGLRDDYWIQDDYNLQIRTEQSIGAKRDDLRIEAWHVSDEEEDALEILWTVEVKVGASIHVSSYQDMDESAEEDNVADVSQLINYDLWLQQASRLNPSAHVAGFVLALGDMNQHLPPNLGSQWVCITWTQLGQQVEELLESQSLQPQDEFLGRHMVGFIRKHLWRDTEMKEPTVEFDDIALIRAFGSMGYDCERKINELVAPLVAVLANSIDGIGNVTHQKSLFKASTRSVVYSNLIGLSQPYIFAGVDKSTLHMWLEISQNDKSFQGFMTAINDTFPALTQRNADWTKDTVNSYHRLSLSEPLHNLLQAEDQASAITGFVANALEDLNEAGVVAALKAELVDGATNP